jgi:GxxExxY protein
MIYEKALCDLIIKCAFEVYNILGNGYLEKVYENALIEELKRNNISSQSQVPIKVFYKNTVVGDYYADIIIENKVLIELKHTISINEKHVAQLLNYLKATNIKVGYIINFGDDSKLLFKRYVL